MNDVFSKPAQRSKEYLDALVELGGDAEAAGIPNEETPHQELSPAEAAMARREMLASHGPSAWGGPRPLRSNWRCY